MNTATKLLLAFAATSAAAVGVSAPMSLASSQPKERQPDAADRLRIATAVAKRMRKQLGRRVDVVEVERMLDAGRTEVQIRDDLGR